MAERIRIAFNDAQGREAAALEAPVDTWVRVPEYLISRIYGGICGPAFRTMFQDDSLVMLTRSTIEGAVTTFTGTWADAVGQGWDPHPPGLVSAKGGLSAHASILRADGTYEE